MRLVKFIPDKTNIDFMKYHKIAMLLSLAVIMTIGALLWQRGLNLGIDFAGGVLLEVRLSKQADLPALREHMNSSKWGEVSLQSFGKPTDVLIRVETSAEEEQAVLVETLKAHLLTLDNAIEFRKVDYVGPTVGSEMIDSGAIALIVAFAGMMLYIWFRFEWQYGVGGITALIHDACIMVGFYVVSGYEFDLTSIAAILTIIGYSINDSVVIYDRIRENLRKYKKMPIPGLINLSLNETLSRTIVTAVTTLLAALALAVFGGEVIRGFSLAFVLGVVIGTYSTVYIATPLLVYFQLRRSASAASEEAAA